MHTDPLDWCLQAYYGPVGLVGVCSSPWCGFALLLPYFCCVVVCTLYSGDRGRPILAQRHPPRHSGFSILRLLLAAHTVQSLELCFTPRHKRSVTTATEQARPLGVQFKWRLVIHRRTTIVVLIVGHALLHFWAPYCSGNDDSNNTRSNSRNLLLSERAHSHRFHHRRHKQTCL